jgi:hypothetical protein
MSTTAIVNNVLARVRELLRQHDASYTRHALDLLLADLERDLHRDLEEQIIREIRWARQDWEWDQEREAKLKKRRARHVEPAA